MSWAWGRCGRKAETAFPNSVAPEGLFSWKFKSSHFSCGMFQGPKRVLLDLTALQLSDQRRDPRRHVAVGIGIF